MGKASGSPKDLLYLYYAILISGVGGRANNNGGSFEVIKQGKVKTNSESGDKESGNRKEAKWAVCCSCAYKKHHTIFGHVIAFRRGHPQV